MWSTSTFGKERIYIRILEMNHGRFLHQLPHQMMEAVFHEAVHSTHGRFHRPSFEEECDAFIAGMTVEAIVKGEDIPDLFRIDGMTLGRYLLGAYADLAKNPDYRPVGMSLRDIMALAGLDRPTR